MMNANLCNWINTHREFVNHDVYRAAYIIEDSDERFFLEDDNGVQEFLYDCGTFCYAHYHTCTTIDSMIRNMFANQSFLTSNYGVFACDIKDKE